MSDGYRVDPQALAETAKGINDAIGELKTLGIDGSADVGRGFSGLSLTGMQVGHAGLQAAFDEFCERWSWGVRHLVQDGNVIAQQLHLSAGMYAEMERYGVGVFKDVAAALGGNPHATDEQVERQSWGQILSDATSPDYSAQSWQKAQQDIGHTWKSEMRDLLEHPPGTMGPGPLQVAEAVGDATGHREAISHAEDEMFGPAPTQQGDRH
ncbi:hypothetical protein [Gandjariella thermophila]|uniref:Uncharacterized protein n=1 Tax=Gandjariella thermophila TaxID=1931992 RepID=A0A4D4J7J9_9PSEU|nr:hypothetical protein [Gandjariella thermophila]GDY32631.1 hypothetical protein GTS_42640 [Gandjariella thermophila]